MESTFWNVSRKVKKVLEITWMWSIIMTTTAEVSTKEKWRRAGWLPSWNLLLQLLLTFRRMGQERQSTFSLARFGVCLKWGEHTCAECGRTRWYWIRQFGLRYARNSAIIRIGARTAFLKVKRKDLCQTQRTNHLWLDARGLNSRPWWPWIVCWATAIWFSTEQIMSRRLGSSARVSHSVRASELLHRDNALCAHGVLRAWGCRCLWSFTTEQKSEEDCLFQPPSLHRIITWIRTRQINNLTFCCKAYQIMNSKEKIQSRNWIKKNMSWNMIWTLQQQ